MGIHLLIAAFRAVVAMRLTFQTTIAYQKWTPQRTAVSIDRDQPGIRTQRIRRDRHRTQASLGFALGALPDCGSLVLPFANAVAPSLMLLETCSKPEPSGACMLLGRARVCAANNAERPRLGDCHWDLPLSPAAKPENADTTLSNRSQRVTAQTVGRGITSIDY